MGDVRLVAPRVRVTRDGQDDLEVQTDNRDLIQWERTRLRQRPVWPKFDEAPFQWLTFLSWCAARRQGLIAAELTYERWESEVLAVANVDDENTTTPSEVGGPPEPGPDPG